MWKVNKSRDDRQLILRSKNLDLLIEQLKINIICPITYIYNTFKKQPYFLKQNEKDFLAGHYVLDPGMRMLLKQPLTSNALTINLVCLFWAPEGEGQACLYARAL